MLELPKIKKRSRGFRESNSLDVYRGDRNRQIEMSLKFSGDQQVTMPQEDEEYVGLLFTVYLTRQTLISEINIFLKSGMNTIPRWFFFFFVFYVSTYIDF